MRNNSGWQRLLLAQLVLREKSLSSFSLSVLADFWFFDRGVFLSPNVPYTLGQQEGQMPPPAHAKDSTYALNYCRL